jgi:hypothetical protein
MPSDAATLPLAEQGEYIAPRLRREAFHCPFCGVLARQAWTATEYKSTTNPTRIWVARCFNCKKEAYWLAARAGVISDRDRMVDPEGGNAPLPHPDMPDTCRDDYMEARSIVDRSPRAACALLRLALQQLMGALGEKGKDLNEDIASLVRKGLEPGVQEALDALRVIGKNVVHPGEIDLRDDRDTAVALFEVMNFIIEQRIARPRKLQALYRKLPERARAAIAPRDAN